MIGKILSGLMNFIISLVSLITLPIDNLISQHLPSVESALSTVGNFFNYIIGVIGYAIDFSCISDVALALIVSYWTFVLMATPATSLIKSALKWYDKLKP